jgi:hypothetical protein
VSNAIKYGDCKPIDVTLEAEDDRAVVTIRDRGLGIAQNDHERIFGRFERAESTRHYGGIGLGLWIVKQIIDALGGTVTVESTPGTGSTFTVELPRGQAGAARTVTPANGHGLTGAPVPPSWPRVYAAMTLRLQSAAGSSDMETARSLVAGAGFTVLARAGMRRR